MQSLILVSVGNNLSNTLFILSGVPQGSILGSLLVDIPTVITSQLFKFADDTKCFKGIIFVVDVKYLLEDLKSLFNWSFNNFLSFTKFIFMSFHRKYNSTYIANSHAINLSSSYKDLGIIFTNTLRW